MKRALLAICSFGLATSAACLDDPPAPGCEEGYTLHETTDECVPICITDADCGTGEICQTDGICGPECINDNQCSRPPSDCHQATGTCGDAGCTYPVREGLGCDDANPCSEADICDAEGDCAGSAKDCAVGEACNPDNGNCELLETEGRGEPCDPDAADPGCLFDLICDADNDRCCTPLADCCLSAADCPAVFSDESLCVEPATCGAMREVPACVEGFCLSRWEPEPGGEACAGEICAAGNLACTGGACPASCDSTTHVGCPPDFTCTGGTTCVPPSGLGAACDAAAGGASVCDALALECNVENRLCCSVGEQCCTDWSDCTAQPAELLFECIDRGACDGWLRTLTCQAGRCAILVDTADDSGCNGQECRRGECADATVVDAGVCDAGLCPPQQPPHPCPDGFVCHPSGRACWATCDGDPAAYLPSDRCRSDGDHPDRYCHDDACAPLLRMSDPCLDSGQCLSNLCDPSGVCRGAPGEPCVPFPLPTSVDRCIPVPGRPQGHCGPATADGRAFRCFDGTPACADPCAHWVGNEWQGACGGALNDFTAAQIGLSTALCFDDGAGSERHEFSCENDFDDDGDGIADWEDPDCVTDFWNGASAAVPLRAVGATCETAVQDGFWDVGPAATICATCESGIGGCYDEGCNSFICWPPACTSRFPGQEVVLCSWWDALADTAASCDPAFIHHRPESAACAYGIGCICRADGTAEEWDCHNEGDYDFADDDYDGLVDAADPDCRKAPGEPCVTRSIGTWSDQCGLAAPSDDDACWCNDAECWVGVCIAGGDCPGADDECKFYPNADALGCGAPSDRPDHSPVMMYEPDQGYCLGGAVTPLGSGTPGIACAGWWECASGICGCADAACANRVCWDVDLQNIEDCDWEPCQYRADGTCANLVDVDTGVACFDPELGETDCHCVDGFAHEGDCADGLSTDHYYDGAIDWWDRVDCQDEWMAGMRARLRPGE